MTTRRLTASSLPLLLALPLAAQGVDRDSAWGEDLLFLYDRIQELHPDPFRGASQAEFEETLDEIYASIPDRTDDRMVLELMRFVALLAKEGRDGHSGVRPTTFERLPVALYRFSDGWFVVRAADEALVGARVVAIEGTPVDEVCARFRPYLNHDNDVDLLWRYSVPLSTPRMLHALDLTATAEAATLRLEKRDGTTDDVRLVAIASDEHARLIGPTGVRPPQDDDVLWLSAPGEEWWVRELPDERALYVQYNAVLATGPDGEAIDAFARRIVDTFEASGAERVVLDLRLNGGGNNGTFPPLIAALKEAPSINRRGRLFGLIGRHTFSAAGNFVTVFERELDSILVGEPTGGGPNQYGDARDVTLPHREGLVVRLSTRYHEYDPPDSERSTHTPELAVPLSSADYLEGRDPVLRAALDFGR